MSFADRLKMARIRAGYSLSELSSKLAVSVTPQAISKYENGDMMPSTSVLVALAKSLGVSLDFLMSSQVTALEGVEFRSHAQANIREKAIVESEVIDYVERYLAVEEILELQEKEDELQKLGVIDISRLEEAESRAQAVREAWNLGKDPIPSVTALLEEKNIRVIEIDAHDGFFGLTCKVKRSGQKSSIPVIVKRNVNVERNRFTLAHELGHAVLNGRGEENPEKMMDRFAAAFLMPEEHLKNEVGENRASIAYEELVRLKHMYGVSISALILRLRDIGVISPEAVRKVFNSRARLWLKNEPSPLLPNGDIGNLEQPRRFENYVYRAVTEGLIPINRAAGLLKKPIEDVQQAVRGPDKDTPPARADCH